MDNEENPKTKNCQYCAEEIQIDAVKCKHCGEWLNKELAVKAEQPAVPQFSFKQPIRNFVLLSVFTFGIYEIYWFYRNWKRFKAHKNLDIKPGWRTVGLFVPIVSIVLVYNHLKDIRDFAKEAGCETFSSPGGLTAGYTILGAFWRLPGAFWLLSFLSVYPLAIVQQTLNRYWEKEQPGFAERTKFSGKEIALLIIGGIFLILVLIGTLFLE